ncbi:MAG: hypothetical protein CMJ78_19050 [Planctomycetaceae bacterium]|nr:hypothetical protein [Planctomycetaceae bacterium]
MTRDWMICLVFSVAVVGAAHAEEQAARPIGAEVGGYLRILGIVTVQEELNLDRNQVQIVRTARKQLTKRKRSEFVKVYRSLSDVKPEKRNEKLQQGMQQLAKIGDDADVEILKKLSAPQLERLVQISLQMTGPPALIRKKVSDFVGLTGMQEESVKQILARTRRGGNAKQLSKEERAKRFGKYAKLTDAERAKFAADQRAEREEDDAEILDLLTSQQLQKWNTLLGKKFEVVERSVVADAKRNEDDFE